MLGEPEQGSHAVFVVNDRRTAQSGSLIVRDADREEPLLQTCFDVPANENILAAALPQSREPAMWLIEWKLADGTTGANHYLAGPRPFKLDQYKRWLEMMNLFTRGPLG